MPRPSRRRLLAAAGLGAAALAGCSSPFGADESGPDLPEYDEDALAAIPDDVPEVAVQYPHGVAETHLEDASEQIAASYDHVRSPIGSDDVPNDVVREVLQQLRNRADYRRRTADHDTLGSLELTAGRAGRVAYAYDAAVGDLDAAGARERRDAVRAARADLADALTYAGDDPVETLVTLAAVESELTVTDRSLDRVGVGEEQFETLREVASDPELIRGDHEVEQATDALRAIADLGDDDRSAAVAIANAEHLLERFRAATDGRRDYEDRFVNAGRDLLESVAERAADYDVRAARDDPLSQVNVDPAVEGTPAETVLSELLGWVPSEDHVETLRGVDGPAWKVLLTHGRAQHLDGVERAVEWIENGRFDVPADAEAVASRRRDAVDAVESAVPSATHPRLTERGLTRAHHLIRMGNEELSMGPRPWRVQRAAGAYGAATVLVDVLPETNAWLVDALA